MIHDFAPAEYAINTKCKTCGLEYATVSNSSGIIIKPDYLFGYVINCDDMSMHSIYNDKDRDKLKFFTCNDILMRSILE